MEAIRLLKIVEKDSEIIIRGLPCKKGQYMEMVLLIEPSALPKRSRLTARQLLHSSLIGSGKTVKILKIVRLTHVNLGNSRSVKIENRMHRTDKLLE
ncbi:MAG TPA: hypothetical protein VFF49_03645 [Thermodesulfobacteriota bacterium]|nr:hypothetical protein [Thermodesulfobacteriota bacterium]